MARPRPDLPDPQAIRALIDQDGRLAVRVTPGARMEAVTVDSGMLCVKTRARAQDGAANEAVRGLLAKALEIAPSRVHLLRGATSRAKLFAVRRAV